MEDANETRASKPDLSQKIQEMLEKQRTESLEGAYNLDTSLRIANHILGSTVTLAKGYVQLGLLDMENAKGFAQEAVKVVRSVVAARAEKEGKDVAAEKEDLENYLSKYWEERCNNDGTFGDWSPINDSGQEDGE